MKIFVIFILTGLLSLLVYLGLLDSAIPIGVGSLILNNKKFEVLVLACIIEEIVDLHTKVFNEQ